MGVDHDPYPQLMIPSVTDHHHIIPVIVAMADFFGDAQACPIHALSMLALQGSSPPGR